MELKELKTNVFFVILQPNAEIRQDYQHHSGTCGTRSARPVHRQCGQVTVYGLLFIVYS
jgi:hypothetical protein